MSFSERLNRLLKEKALNANELSKIIEVQRSTLSHLISGRNKPSLDLIERFYTAFPDIRLEWLILGKGSMYTPANEARLLDIQPQQEVKEEIKPEASIVIEVPTPLISKEQEVITQSEKPLTSIPSLKESRNITKTILFFDDNTFEIYLNSQL